MTFGEKLKIARINMKMTQKELSDKLSEYYKKIYPNDNISFNNRSISNWEVNVSKPDADTISLLCLILDIDANYLLGITEQSNIDSQEELELLKKVLREKGLLDENDQLTNEDFDRLIRFAMDNKDYLIRDK